MYIEYLIRRVQVTYITSSILYQGTDINMIEKEARRNVRRLTRRNSLVNNPKQENTSKIRDLASRLTHFEKMQHSKTTH